MKNAQRINASIVVLALLCAGAMIKATPSDPLAFTTGRDMKVAIVSHLHDPRATYNIIMRAHRQGLAPEATVVYYELMKKKPANPYLQSAYAFSHYWATGNYTTDYLTTEQRRSPMVRDLEGHFAEAEGCRLQAIRSAPESPEILLETAVAMFNANTYYHDEDPSKQVAQDVEWMRKAHQLAPEWSAPYYYLGDFLCQNVRPGAVDGKKMHAESLAYLQQAEKMDPDWHVECLPWYASDYAALEEWDKAATYADAYIQARPRMAKIINLYPVAANFHQLADAQRKRKIDAGLPH